MTSNTAGLVLAAIDPLHDSRESWAVDGTLIPPLDHQRAAKSKNYRWSCNAQVLVRRRDLQIVATTAGGPGNRNDPLRYRVRGSRRCVANTVACSWTEAVAASASW